MRPSFFVLIAIIFFTTSCSRDVNDPCENKNPMLEITVEADKLVCFESVDSYDLDYKGKEKIIINGRLYTPKNKNKFYDAVILTHGSGGIRRYHQKYVELLTEMGYVVFQIDHYAARRIKYDKTFSKVSGLTFMNDAYSALNILKKNKNIKNVGYLGWSQGGVGPILSHFEFINQLIPTDYRFQAAVAIYPYCGFTFPDNTETQTPLLMITGADDDLTPEAACRNIYSKFLRDDRKINFMSIKGARHGFDNPFLYFGITFDKLPNLKIINDECTLTINNNGEIENLKGVVINTPEISEFFLNKCSYKGVTVKYNSKATEKTLNKIETFFRRNLSDE
tara:strand:+ start:1181 stop:2188 length:1008 start_codon:yes stop_codon:yes gene_type:complete